MLGAPLRLAIRICNPPSALLGAVLRLGVRLFGKRRRSLFYRTLRFVVLSAEARGAPRPTAAPVAVAPPDAPPPQLRCSPPAARPARSFVESMAVPHFRRFAEATAHASAAPAAPAAEEAVEEAAEEAAEEAPRSRSLRARN